MKSISRNLPYVAAALVSLVVGLATVSVFGQEKVVVEKSVKEKINAEAKSKLKEFCGSNNWSSDDKVSYRDLRETTLTAGGTINVDGGQNGGIAVRGEDRGDVLVRACVQTWGKTDEAAKAAAGNVKINTSGTIKAENSADDKNWSVSYQILVPRSTNINLKAHNGGISISGIDGSAEFETTNGGVHLGNVSGDIKGRTTNGGVNVSLSGSTWKGSGLNVQTTNGGVHLSMPENYAAHIETGTVNGGFSSDIPALTVEKYDRERGHQPVKINTDINGGGAPIRVVTTNGGVRIETPDRD